MLNVGLLGAGRIAGLHASAITSNLGSRLAAVSDFIPKNAAKLAARYSSQARTTDAIIADPSIDAVLIASSTDTHSDLIERATAAGKAVLCEKPVAVWATGSSIVDPAIGAAGDFDTADVTLSNADGRIAVIKNSRETHLFLP